MPYWIWKTPWLKGKTPQSSVIVNCLKQKEIQYRAIFPMVFLKRTMVFIKFAIVFFTFAMSILGSAMAFLVFARLLLLLASCFPDSIECFSNSHSELRIHWCDVGFAPVFFRFAISIWDLAWGMAHPAQHFVICHGVLRNRIVFFIITKEWLIISGMFLKFAGGFWFWPRALSSKGHRFYA